jgi:NADH:ubiquinone oxidoreductase subunit F (NADH-binding)
VSPVVRVRPTGGPGGPLLDVRSGPFLLRDLVSDPALALHRHRSGPLPRPSLPGLVEDLAGVDVRGRGGAGFPFATKLRTTAESGRRREVVVNVSEGEPASFKDAALALTRPHLVLDGAAVCARALGTRRVHVVLPGDRPGVAAALRRAVAERERSDERLRWLLHTTDPGFVAGQARAVVELVSGRPNLPVTAWAPEARSGYRGRPTLLSNAETFAHVALLLGAGSASYRTSGTADEPGSRLLTIGGESGRPVVVEATHGTPWPDLLDEQVLSRPVLVGGYHGTWAAPGALRELTLSRTGMAAAGLTLGAGVVLPLAAGDCPVHRTAAVTAYLAGQSAGRCGPCRNGLPALTEGVRALDEGVDLSARVGDLTRTVTGRGACAHPDGTARMVRSMLALFGDELDAHAAGECTYRHADALPGLRSGR